jgi:dihydropteroate synthase
MRSFKHVATLIKNKRISHPKHYSQADLSIMLGYKNGQFISNVERGLCSVPLKMMKEIAVALEISPEELKASMLKDHEETLTYYLSKKEN